MSGSFDIRLGTADDEPDLRHLVGSTPMPGAVTVRFAREPDYFLGTTIMGDPCDVIVGRHLPDGALAGMACRAERQSFVSGVETRTGYLGQIRIAEGLRGNWLIQRGARLARELSPPGLVYLGVIARENPRARGALIERRPPGGLRAQRLSGLTTCAILLRRRQPRPASGIRVGCASDAMMPQVVAFLRGHGASRQFFPAYSIDDFTGGTRMRGLAAHDVMIAHRGDAILGVMAAWDQMAYKQDIVEGYGPALARLRPAYDAAARLVGTRPLTAPGEAMPLSFSACIAVADDDPQVMRALVGACATRAFERGHAYLMVGLADGDPLLPVVRRWPHVTYHSDIFAFSWDADPAGMLDRRIPYVEIATL